MPATPSRLPSLKRPFSIAAVASGLLLVAGCNMATIERPQYGVSEVQSFKTAGAPSRVMMLEIVDANNTFADDFWSAAMSNHGYPPRLRFVTDPAAVKDGETIKPENRVVAVVNPEQTTMRGTLCTDPKSREMDVTSDTVTVRFGFCVGDKIISETRAHYNKDQFAEQVENSAANINYQLFPRSLNDNDRHCSPFMPNC